MKKRMLAIVLALGLVLGLISACGASEQSEPAVSAASEQEATQMQEESQVPDVEPFPEAAEESALETDSSENLEPEAPKREYVSVPLPLTEEPVTMSYWTYLKPFLMPYNLNLPDLTFYKEMEARTGVQLDITAVMVFTAAENFNLMVASGDYADMMDSFQVYFTGNADSAIDQGIILDLMDYSDLMPNYMAALDSNESFWRDSITQEGALPSANMLMATGEGSTIGMMIREDWLDAVGMDVPVTYDDMEAVLAAFKEEFGVAALALGGYGQNYGISAGLGVRDFDDADVSKSAFLNVDGEVLYSPATEGYREYLTLLNDWYNKGYVWKDFISEANNAYSYLVSSQLGVVTTERDNLQYVTNALQVDDPNAGFIGMRSLRKDPDEILKIKYFVESIIYGVSVSASSDYAELAIKWLDYCYSPEGQLLTNYGIEGEGLTYDEEGNPCFSDLVLHSDTYSAVAATVAYATYGGAMLCNGARVFDAYEPRVQDAINLWDSDTQDWVYPTKVTLTTEQGEEYTNLINEMNSYIAEQTLKFIVGEVAINDESWNAYMDTLESMGLTRVLEIKTDALNVYLSNGVHQ